MAAFIARAASYANHWLIREDAKVDEKLHYVKFECDCLDSGGERIPAAESHQTQGRAAESGGGQEHPSG